MIARIFSTENAQHSRGCALKELQDGESSWTGMGGLASIALPTGVRGPRLSARAVGTMCRAQRWGGCSAPRADL